MDSHCNSYGLLPGYALEDVLKEIWLVRGGTFADVERPDRFAPIQGLKDHDLLALATRVGVELNTFERSIVDHLSYWITVAGRYPIPMRAVDMKSRKARGEQVGLTFLSSDDWQTAREGTIVAR